MAQDAWGLDKGTLAPDLTLPNIEGRTVRLSELRGKVVVLKLGTTWCSTCGEQEEELAKAAAQLKAQQAVVVDIFLQESADDVRAYLKRKKRLGDGVILLDDDQARRAYGVYLIPRLLIIDRNFRIERDGGLMLADELVAAVRGAGVRSK